MDLTNRGARPSQPGNAPVASGQGPAHHSGPTKNGKFKKIKSAKWLNVASIALLFGITVIIIGLLLQIALSDANKEEKYIDNTKMQAVFLNNGQVYFGKITELNSKYVNMGNIYYLRVNQQVQPGRQPSQNDVSLVKLGCELHGPQDLMTINREQVTFWENLKDDGQVTKAIAEYVKQNPNGQNCEQQAQQQAAQENTTPESNAAEEAAPTNNLGGTDGGNNTPAPANNAREDN
jgi:hypothetical protein